MKCLKSFDKFGVITYLTDGDKTYIECIVESAIPFQPGVYLVYGIKAGNVYDLLYFGKPGMPLMMRHIHQNVYCLPLPCNYFYNS